MLNRIYVGHYYIVTCIRNGWIVWRDEFENMVPLVGRNKYLDATLKTGLASPLWYVGLKNSGTIADADAMNSHTGWTENAEYSNATRPAWTPGTIADSSVDNSASPAEFTIDGNTTIYGLFLCDNNTVSGTTGTLLGVGDLTTPRSVLIGDTLNAIIVCEMGDSGS
jgi:hypothetical protein